MVNPFVEELKMMGKFFHTTVKVFEEKDSGFVPVEGIFTVTNHVAHTAQTIDWFVEGAFRPEGFRMEFEELEKEMKACNSFEEAMKWFDKSIDNACNVIGAKTEQEMFELLPEGIMGGVPKVGIISAMNDHTAHHRGALTVYARMLGKAPTMPYEDM